VSLADRRGSSNNSRDLLETQSHAGLLDLLLAKTHLDTVNRNAAL
jgi:hypothetical protein